MVRSLTARLACRFALLAAALLGAVGLMLHSGLVTRLTLRDNTALVSRIEQIRTFLQNSDPMRQVRDMPGLLQTGWAIVKCCWSCVTQSNSR